MHAQPSRWEVRKGALGWMVLEHTPGDAVPTQRSGYHHTRRQAQDDLRFKRDLAAGKFAHIGPPTTEAT